MHRFMKYLLTTIALLTLMKAQDRPIEIKLLAGGHNRMKLKLPVRVMAGILVLSLTISSMITGQQIFDSLLII